MTVAQTSLFAFEAVRQDLSERQRLVYHALDPEVDYSNTEISRLINLPINCITPRVLELRQKGLLTQANTRQCKVTGKPVMTWRKT